MRLGVTLDLAAVPAGSVPATVAACEQAGLDLVVLQDPRGQTSLAVAASCAAVTGTLLVGCRVEIAAGHPLYLAEERNVTDQLLAGRLITVLAGAVEDPDGRLAEWAGVLLAAAGTAPFVHRGPEHVIPAALPENTVNPEQRVRVTPAPFSLDPALWVAGSGAAAVAATFALPVLSEPGTGDYWPGLTEALGPAALRLRRPAVRTWSPAREDPVDLAVRVATERDAWGLDTLLVAVDGPAPGSGEWRAALADLVHVVAPRLQQHRLPSGLEDLWTRDHQSRRQDREQTTDKHREAIR